jgi:hypothetical protein
MGDSVMRLPCVARRESDVMTTKLKSLLLFPAFSLLASLCLAESWKLESNTTKGESGPVAVTTLSVSEEDHGEQVTLRVSCRADGLVSAGLRLSKPVEREDVMETSTARYASVIIHFQKEREAKAVLRSTLGDKWLQFDDASTPDDPEAEALSSERWSVERLVRQLGSHRKVTFRVSIEDSQDFQEGFNITGFRELAAPLAKQCPEFGEWLSATVVRGR